MPWTQVQQGQWEDVREPEPGEPRNMHAWMLQHDNGSVPDLYWEEAAQIGAGVLLLGVLFGAVLGAAITHWVLAGGWRRSRPLPRTEREMEMAGGAEPQCPQCGEYVPGSKDRVCVRCCKLAQSEPGVFPEMGLRE